MPRKPKLPWVRTIRRETGLIEHICKHGVGHPASGSVHWMSLQPRAHVELNGQTHFDVHGCDRCCQTPEWRLADALEGQRIANELLFSALSKLKQLAVVTAANIRKEKTR